MCLAFETDERAVKRQTDHAGLVENHRDLPCELHVGLDIPEASWPVILQWSTYLAGTRRPTARVSSLPRAMSPVLGPLRSASDVEADG